ncbi:hypothetical protein GCG54_00011204 [Colletotrichum gloeosporioides]|uniref:Uncharacterized protein n=1 Tax=Colletotrichum gloeosporioides TaxID=474922 RepID=A0A8H4CS17_COLGL|nr:uncharacterized protein GCG54_00011204 [Colletotrichum gloeosporioides]KAF3809010.1 hypothetical protein GCG54_00011204 [Colletotrichum gloeosporioides]
MARTSTLIAALAAAIPLCLGFTVTASGDASVLANAIFTGPGVSVLSATFSGSATSSGTFTDGLGGIGNGAILTTGSAAGALPGGDHYVNNGAGGSNTYCGTNTFNAAILSVSVAIANGYNGVQVEFIMASEEEGGSPDPIGIFLGSQQYAIGYDGQRITATSPYFDPPIVITPPNSVSSYPGSTPPLLVGIPATGTTQMVFAICDFSDTEWDSALMLKAVQFSSQNRLCDINGYCCCGAGVHIDGEGFRHCLGDHHHWGYCNSYVHVDLDDFIELNDFCKFDEFCKFDDSAVHEQYFNRLFPHVHNIFNDDIVKHTRVINHFHRELHDTPHQPIVVHNYSSTVDIRHLDVLNVSEHFSLCSNNVNVLEYDNLFSSHISDFPSKYFGVVQRFFDNFSRVVDAQNFQHEYFHVFPLYKFIIKRSSNTRADAITINNDQFCKQCPFHAHIDISSRHKRRYNSVFNWCASELRQCPYITNQLASQLFFIFSESSLNDLQQCPNLSISSLSTSGIGTPGSPVASSPMNPSTSLPSNPPSSASSDAPSGLFPTPTETAETSTTQTLVGTPILLSIIAGAAGQPPPSNTPGAP